MTMYAFSSSVAATIGSAEDRILCTTASPAWPPGRGTGGDRNTTRRPEEGESRRIGRESVIPGQTDRAGGHGVTGARTCQRSAADSLAHGVVRPMQDASLPVVPDGGAQAPGDVDGQ